MDYTRISLYAENLELIRNVGSQYTGYYLRERPASSGHTFESGVISEYHFNDTLIIEIVRAADGEVIFSLEIDNVDMYYYLPFGAPELVVRIPLRVQEPIGVKQTNHLTISQYFQ